MPMLPETPGADENQPLGALSQLQQFRGELVPQYKAAQAGREQSRSALDEHYQAAMDELKKPVRDNSWLHLALGALQPSWSPMGSVLSGAQSALAEQERVGALSQERALGASQLGAEWQRRKMEDYKSEADKLLAQLGGVNRMGQEQARATNAFARQATTLYTQQLEAARRQAEARSDLTPDERKRWIQDTARQNTRLALKQLAPIYEQAGVTVSDEMLNSFLPSEEGYGAVEKTTTRAVAAQGTGAERMQGVGVIPERLPKEVSDEVNRLVTRLQSRPSPELHKNTLKRLKEIQAQYPQAQPAVSELPSFGIAPQAEATRTVAPDVGGRTIAEIKAQEAGMKTKAEEMAKSATPGEKIVYETYDKLKDFPANVETWNHALTEWDKSKSEFGTGAEFMNKAKSFLNNRLGLDLTPEKVASAQTFAAAMDRYAAAQLRQTDSQPALKQLEMLRAAIGTLENDPNAVPKIIQHLQRLAEIQAEGHNKRVQQAGEKGMQSYFDLAIPVPPIIKKFGTDPKTGRRVAKYSDGSIKYVGE